MHFSPDFWNGHNENCTNLALSTPLLRQKQVYIQLSGCCAGCSHLCKNKKQQTASNGWGWILRSGGGQVGETTRSTSTAPPTIRRSTYPRQHQPKDLSILQRDIHLIEIKYCEDARLLEPAERSAGGAAQSPLLHPPRSQFQIKPATLLIPNIFFSFWWRSLYLTPKWLLFLN